MRKLRRTRQSFDDLFEILCYINKDNPQAAHRLVQTIEDKIKLICEFPGVGPEVSDIKEPGIHMFPVGNYVLLYEVKTESINLLRVIHGNRDWKSLWNK